MIAAAFTCPGVAGAPLRVAVDLTDGVTPAAGSPTCPNAGAVDSVFSLAIRHASIISNPVWAVIFVEFAPQNLHPQTMPLAGTFLTAKSSPSNALVAL